MAVVTLTAADDADLALYVPFRTSSRGGRDGGDPVGTLSINAGATGAAGGGTVTITITMGHIIHGFHPLFVPTYVSISDSLTTAEEVSLAYNSGGNERLVGSLTEAELLIAVAGQNAKRFQSSGLLIEPVRGGGSVMSAVWQTNTDTKTYHLHIFGYMFDAELLVTAGRLEGLSSGLT